MPSIVIELTNHCNLSCQHCLDGRHSSDGGNLKIEIVEKILQDAKGIKIDFLSFTGGEPTLHPRFTEILKKVYEAEYNFGFVTNGWNFTEMYRHLLPFRDRLRGITFSLDGSREETHDRIRGKGSYRRVMQDVSICIVKDIPFTINTTVMFHTKGKLKEMAELATKLGSRGLRFGHLMPTPRNIANGLTISPEECVVVEGMIGKLQQSFTMPIIMAPGYYTTNLFPCATLQMQEFNIDWRGNVTFCCHMSGHGNGTGNKDVIGNLDEMSFAETYKRFINLDEKFRKEKIERHSKREFKDSDYFPCWYCVNYFKKVD
ncbi:MAG: radical SAM protein [Candidatus Scalindua sp.]|nr:radical SAM protein [Candidatus Scalindua sp.]